MTCIYRCREQTCGHEVVVVVVVRRGWDKQRDLH